MGIYITFFKLYPGLRGLYRGYLLTLSVYIPQTTIFFVLYERLKRAAAGMLLRDPNLVTVSVYYGYFYRGYFSGRYALYLAPF